MVELLEAPVDADTHASVYTQIVVGFIGIVSLGHSAGVFHVRHGWGKLFMDGGMGVGRY